MARTDDKGAIAFFDYYWAAYGYAYRTLDPARLYAMSDPGCKFCAGVAKDIKYLRDRNRSVQGGAVHVDWATTPKGDGHDGAWISAAISQELLLTFTPSGEEASRDAPLSGQRVDAIVGLRERGWVMVGLSVIKSGKS